MIANLAAATPAEIDTEIAELESAWYAHDAAANKAITTLHYAIGDRERDGRWGKTTAELFATIAKRLADGRRDFERFHHHTAEDIAKALVNIHIARGEQDVLQREIDRLEAEYKRRPWSRFFQLRTTDGARIHDTRWCSGLFRSNHADLGWHPELSGKTEEQAVAELGPVMCSKCFRSAPVEWKRDPKDLKVNPNACPGAEQYPVEGTRRFQRTWNGGYDEAKCTGCGEFKRLRSTDYRIGKHDKPKKPVNEITMPGSDKPLKVGSDIVKTVRTAEISYTDDAAYLEACRRGYQGTGRVQEATEHAALVLEALATKNGTTVEAERDRLAPKVAKKAKQYGL